MRLSETVVRLVVVVHHRLNLSLIVEARYLGHRLAVLVPETIDRVLTSSLFSLRIFATFPLRLLLSNLNGIGPSIWFLFWLLLIEASAHVGGNDDWVLVQCRICPHSHASSCLARSKLSILICLVVHVPK